MMIDKVGMVFSSLSVKGLTGRECGT